MILVEAEIKFCRGGSPSLRFSGRSLTRKSNALGLSLRRTREVPLSVGHQRQLAAT